MIKTKHLTLSSLNRKLILKPCTKIAKFFSKLRRRKPLSIKSLRFRRRRLPGMTSIFRSPLGEREIDRVTELASFPDHKVPHPSPLTPAYIRMSAAAAAAKVAGEDDEVEEACRSFEKYVVEMIVEEGKMRDLADVEELLYYWNGLKSPVFLDLVCRFYRELCSDLFSGNDIMRFT